MAQQNSLNRPDQSIEIGPRHGYRIEGDHAFINAELQIPPQHRSSGEWALELWAAERPYEDGPLTGLKVAQVALELPTPIGPYVHQVDTRTAARLPLQGRAHAMVLALVQQVPGAETSVRAFANYAQPQIFAAPHFEGTVGYRMAGAEIVLQADGIANPRSESNLSGTLSLELWAFPLAPVSGPATEGLRLAAAALEPVAGQLQLSAIERRAAFSEPPVGDHRLALVLCEWTKAHGYVARDRRDFGLTYERPATVPEVREPSRVRARPAVAPAPARSVDLRLVPAVEPAAPARPVPPKALVVSIQTGSVEDLSQLKGLNLKIAQEIVKARPFASVADLIRVPGIGPKTLDRLKDLVRI